MGKRGGSGTPDLIVDYDIEEMPDDYESEAEREAAAAMDYREALLEGHCTQADLDAIYEAARYDEDGQPYSDESPGDPLEWATARAQELNREAQREGKQPPSAPPPEARPRPEPRTSTLNVPPERPAGPRASERARASVEQAADELGRSVSTAGRSVAAAVGSLVDVASNLGAVGAKVAGLAGAAVRGFLGLFRR